MPTLFWQASSNAPDNLSQMVDIQNQIDHLTKMIEGIADRIPEKENNRSGAIFLNDLEVSGGWTLWDIDYPSTLLAITKRERLTRFATATANRIGTGHV